MGGGGAPEGVWERVGVGGGEGVWESVCVGGGEGEGVWERECVWAGGEGGGIPPLVLHPKTLTLWGYLPSNSHRTSSMKHTLI